MPKRIQFRRDTADNWAFHNPRLMPGEIGMETDTQQFKIGDGDLDWEDLPYYMSLGAMEGALDDATEQAVLDATTLAAGYKDAAAGSAAAAAASASASSTSAGTAATSATNAQASATAAAAVGTTNDGVVSALVANPSSATNDAIEALVVAAPHVQAMTTTARDALGPGISTGRTIYNTTIGRLETWNGSTWTATMTIVDTLGAAYSTHGANIDLGGTGAVLNEGASSGTVSAGPFKFSDTGQPAFGSGFSSGVGSISSTFWPSYTKMANGDVVLKGDLLYSSGITSGYWGGTLATLPVGYRPARTRYGQIFSATSSTWRHGVWAVTAAGAVVIQFPTDWNAGAPNDIVLDVVQFPTT
jgi:hypothetical protein